MALQPHRPYQAFLLRCWLMPPAIADDAPNLHIVLRTVSAEPTEHRFNSLQQLSAFISAEMQSSSDPISPPVASRL